MIGQFSSLLNQPLSSHSLPLQGLCTWLPKDTSFVITSLKWLKYSSTQVSTRFVWWLCPLQLTLNPSLQTDLASFPPFLSPPNHTHLNSNTSYYSQAASYLQHVSFPQAVPPLKSNPDAISSVTSLDSQMVESATHSSLLPGHIVF